MASPSDVVREFCSAFPSKDLGTIERLLDDSAVYHNVGMEPAVGKDASLSSIKGFFDMFESLEFRILALGADGDTVLTERTDVLTANGVPAPLPVMGVFEVRDGRIVAWRDYFDMGLAGRLMAGEAVDPKLLP